MNLQQSIVYVRVFSVLMLGLASYLLWVPFFGSLSQGTGRVASVTNLVSGRVSADFQLDNGVSVKCYGKSWISSYCPYEGLSRLAATQEKVTIWYKGGKAWQVVSVTGEKIIDYAAARHHLWMLLGIIGGILGGMAIFAPVLIRQP